MVFTRDRWKSFGRGVPPSQMTKPEKIEYRKIIKSASYIRDVELSRKKARDYYHLHKRLKSVEEKRRGKINPFIWERPEITEVYNFHTLVEMPVEKFGATVDKIIRGERGFVR